jgi:hypothetical protein
MRKAVAAQVETAMELLTRHRPRPPRPDHEEDAGQAEDGGLGRASSVIRNPR